MMQFKVTSALINVSYYLAKASEWHLAYPPRKHSRSIELLFAPYGTLNGQQNHGYTMLEQCTSSIFIVPPADVMI